MPNWDKYRIRRREKVEIDNVPHIAHVPTAQRIIEDGRIKSGPIPTDCYSLSIERPKMGSPSFVTPCHRRQKSLTSNRHTIWPKGELRNHKHLASKKMTWVDRVTWLRTDVGRMAGRAVTFCALLETCRTRPLPTPTAPAW